MEQQMNELEYKQFYDRVGRTNGWNFSRLQCHADGVEWDFYKEVARRCRSSDLLLDIGTGGGEALLSIADAVQLAVGIDSSKPMAHTAAVNSQASGLKHVRFFHMD